MFATLPVPLATLATFALAWIVIVAVPGPTITVIVANALRGGTAAGLATVAGTQAVVLAMIAILALGLDTIVESFASVLVWIKFAGAAYLVWLGWKMWRASFSGNGALHIPDAEGGTPRKPAALSQSFWHGLLVLWSNPKAFVFFGAFIPQFITPGQDTTAQVLLLGLLAMLIGAIIDSAYALLGGKAGRLLTRERIRWTESIAGAFLIGGGIWLAVTRQI